MGFVILGIILIVVFTWVREIKEYEKGIYYGYLSLFAADIMR